VHRWQPGTAKATGARIKRFRELEGWSALRPQQHWRDVGLTSAGRLCRGARFCSKSETPRPAGIHRLPDCSLIVLKKSIMADAKAKTSKAKAKTGARAPQGEHVSGETGRCD